MKRTVNSRVAIALVASVSVGAAGLFLAHRLQAGRRASVFLQEARDAEDEEEYGDAIRSFRSYLRLNPADADVHAHLGKLLVDVGNFSSAYATLEQALLLDPSDADSRRQAVRAAMAIERHADARVHLNRLIERQPDGELFDLLGQCQQAAAEFRQAAESYRQAIKLDPGRLDAYFRLANLLTDELEQPREAERWLKELVESNPDAAEAYLFCGRYLKEASERAFAAGQADTGSRKVTAAKRASEGALQRDPENLEALHLLTECELAQRSLSEARKHAQRGHELQPSTHRWYLLLAEIESEAGNADQAIDWIREGLRQTDQGREDLLGNLANMLLDHGRLDEAKQAIDQLRSVASSRSSILYLQGRIAFAEEEWLQASQMLERVRPSFLDNDALLKQLDFWLGQCYQQLRKPDLQLTAYRRAVASDPLWTRARLGVVSALTSVGRTDAAMQELQELLRLPDAPAQGWLEMARLSILKNLRAGPGQANWAASTRLLDQLEQALPDSPAVPILRAEILVAQGQAEQAEALLQEAAEQMPDEPHGWIALANLAQRKWQWERADQILKQAESRSGDGPLLRLARAVVISRRSGEAAAQQLRQLAEPNDAFTVAERVRLWNGLAQRAMATGDFEFAEELLIRVSQHEPNDLQIWLLRFEVALRQEKVDRLDDVLAQIREIEGEGPLWHYGTAVHLRLTSSADDTDRLAQALVHLGEARKERPGWSRLSLLAGDIRLMQGQTEAAIENFVEAIERGERDSEVVRQTVQLLYQRQRYREADELIRVLEERQTPFSANLGRLASQVSMQLQDFERALDVARQAADASDDYADQIWLGQLASLVGSRLEGDRAADDQQQLYEEAEQAFRRAVALAEKEPETWVALVQFLSRAGRTEKVEPILRLAESKIPPDRAPLALAQCREQLGQMKEAKEHYAAAIRLAPRDPSTLRAAADVYLRTGEPQKAERYLARLQGLEEAGNGNVIWARRQLALIELSRGGWEHLNEAQRLIEENLKVTPSSLPDLRTRALVLAAYQTPQERAQAIATWKQVLEKDPFVSPEHRFALAQLYRADENWPEAARQMRSLIASSQNHPNYQHYVAEYIAGLIAHDELSEAELWIQRMQDTDADASTVASLRAGALSRRGSHQQAIQTLVGIVRSENRLAVARRLESLGNTQQSSAEQTLYYKKAEELLRAASQEDAAERLTLAAFLARRDQLDAALSEVEKAQAVGPAPDSLRAVIETVIASDSIGPAQLSRAEKALTQLLTEHDDTAGLRLTLARVHIAQQQLGKAASVYQEILQEDPNQVIALNNLAMLLLDDAGQLDRAEQLVEKALQVGGRMPSLLDSHACVALAQGDAERAAAMLEEALARAPSPTIYFHLAVAYHRLGRQQERALALANAQDANLNADELMPLEKQWHAELMQ